MTETTSVPKRPKKGVRSTTNQILNHLQEVFDLTSEGVLFYNYQGRIIDANPAIAKILSTSVEKLKTLKIDDLGCGLSTDESLIDTEFKVLFNDPDKCVYETKFEVPKGKTIPLRVTRKNIQESGYIALISEISIEEEKKTDSTSKGVTTQNEQNNKVDLGFTVEGDSLGLSQLLQGVVENSFIHIVVKDTKGRYIYANQLFIKLYGKKLHEVIGHKASEVIPGKSGKILDKIHREVIETGLPIEREITVQYDNTEKVFLMRKFPLTDEQGKIYAVAGFSSDITKDKENEHALQQSEGFLKDLYNSTPVMMHSIDKNARLIEVNDYWLKEMGYKREEVIGKKITSFATTESRKASLSKHLPDFFKKGTVTDLPLQLVKKNGEIMEVMLSARSEKSKNGEVFRSKTVLKDVTELTKAQRILEQKQQLLDGVFENDNTWIYVKDLEGRYIMVNKVMAERFGKSKDEIVGRKVETLLDEDMVKQSYEFQRQVISKKKTVRSEDQLRINGEVSIIDSFRFPIFNYKGEVTAIAGICQDITEIKKKEEELRNSERRFRTLIETTPIPVVISRRKDGQILYANPSFARMFGDTSEYFQTLKIGSLAQNQEDKKRFYDEMRGNKEVKDFEIILKKRDGTTFWASTTTTRINFLGETAFSTSLDDISARKSYEIALRRNEERYKNLYHKTPIMMHSLNHSGDIISVNQHWLDVMGYTLEEVIGKKSIDFLTPESKKFVKEVTFPRFLKEGILNDTDIQFKKKNGEVIDAVLNASIERDGDGNVESMFAVIKDVTAQKKVERDLIESERHFSSLAAVSPVGIYRTDRDNQCIYVNDNWCKLSGLTPEQAMGNGWVDALHPADRDRVFGEWNESFKKNQPFNSEYRFQRPDGNFSWVYGTAVGEIDSEGNLKGYVGTVTDITQLKEAEDQLEQAIIELEETNKQLVEKEELERVNKNLSRANSELKEFAYMASHDLKAPLRGISNLTTWLQADYKDVFDKDGIRNLELLVSRVKWMEQLINDILMYSKLGSENIRPEMVDLNELVSRCLKMLHLPENCEVNVLNELPSIRGVPSNWIQVFQNLIDNAIKHANKAAIRIDIDVQSDDLYHTISIKDNGPGIDAKHSKRVFKIFQTLKNKYSDNRTGIGLSIVKKVVELNQGDIWIESELGKGSTFYFTIPI